MNKGSILSILILILMLALAGCHFGIGKYTEDSSYPNHPINFIMPLGSGSSSDMLARTLEKVALKYLDQPIVITNKTGGGGVLGIDKLVRADADGYTIGFVNSSIFYQTIYGRTEYYYPSALEPLAQITQLPSVVMVNKTADISNMRELSAYAQKLVQPIKFGNDGLGGIDHIHSLAIAKCIGIKIAPVPFTTAREAVNALIGGHIQVVLADPYLAKEMLKTGYVAAIATTGAARLNDPALQAIPTLEEQGIDFVAEVWGCIAAPKQLPPAVKKKLTDAIDKMIADAEFQSNLSYYGIKIAYLDSKAVKLKWRDEDERLKIWLYRMGVLDSIQNKRGETH